MENYKVHDFLINKCEKSYKKQHISDIYYIQKRINMKYSFLIMIILCSSIFLIQINTDDAKGQTGSLASPDVIIDLDEDSVSISLEPGFRDEHVMITGTLRCKMPPTVPDEVGCTVYLIPNINYFGIEGETEFLFTEDVQEFDLSYKLTIPDDYTEKDLYFTLKGRWQYSGGRGGGDISSVSCIVKIQKFGSIDLYMLNEEPYTINAHPGDHLDVWLVIKNLGNEEDRVALSVESDNPGVSVQIDNETVGVGIGRTRKESFKVNVDDNFKGGSMITVEAQSSMIGNRSYDSFTLLVKVDEPARDDDRMFIHILLLIVIVVVILSVIGYFIHRRSKTQ